MVGDFFALLGEGQGSENALTPTVRSLLGALGNKSWSEKDYYRYLEKKHR